MNITTQTEPRARARTGMRIPRGLYTDPRLLEVSPITIAVLIWMIVWAESSREQTVEGEERPDVGWMVAEDGEPYTITRIAKRTRFSAPAVKAAINELGAAKFVVCSDLGAFGIIGWRLGIGEDPSTQRVRKHRMKGAA